MAGGALSRAARHLLVGLALTLLVVGHTSHAAAQSSVPERSHGWHSATTVMALSAAGVQLLMPRVFYADPEVTAGWKGRWHVSALAPSMTLGALALANEQWFKPAFEGHRPGCSASNDNLTGCESYGLFSTQTQLAFSALGQGTGVFLVDTLKWSDGEFSGASLAGNVGIPLVLSILTAVGRTSGDWESAGQVWGSAGVGFASGIGMGVLYAMMQRPECGYGGSLICW